MRLSRLTCHWISCCHFYSTSMCFGLVSLRSCGAMRILLCVTWKPDGDVDVASGQFLILFIQSVVVIMLGIVSSVVHFFMCLMSACSKWVCSGASNVPLSNRSVVCVENLNQMRTDRRTVDLRFSWEGVLNHTWISPWHSEKGLLCVKDHQKEICHICTYEWRMTEFQSKRTLSNSNPNG